MGLVNRRERDILQAFAVSARPIMIAFAGFNSCIAATRVTVDTLRMFGINARPLPTKFALEIPRHGKIYSSGLSDEELSRAANQIQTPWESGWRGHLVAAMAIVPG